MALRFDVCVRGSGIVGRCLALLMARERLRVGLVTKPALSGKTVVDVRAYAINHHSRELLKSLRCWPSPSEATPVLNMKVNDSSAGEVTFSAAKQGSEALAWILDSALLETRLDEAIAYQPLIERVSEPSPAQLTVVCEGKHSLSRSDFDVDFQIDHYNQHAIAARLRCEKPHRQTARQWFDAQSILAFLPLDGPEGQNVAIVWSLKPEHAAELMKSGAEDFCHALESASHNLLGKLSLISERALWPLQKAHTDRWCGTSQGQSWVLAGDAAHSVHPLAGQGLNLGLADVAELTKIIRQRDYWRSLDDEKLLRRYERSRKTDVLAMETGIDALQHVFSLQGGVLATLRTQGMNAFNHSPLLKDWVVQLATNP